MLSFCFVLHLFFIFIILYLVLRPMDNVLKLQLSNANDGEFADIIMDEKFYAILEQVGYQGVPQRETKHTIGNLIRQVVETSRPLWQLELFQLSVATSW